MRSSVIDATYLITRFGSTMTSKFLVVVFGLIVCASSISYAQPPTSKLHSNAGIDQPPNFALLNDYQWKEIEATVDRGISWLVSQQRVDGSYGSNEAGRAGIASLAAMAMISRGHLPGVGEEGKAIDRTIDFLLSIQKPNGLLTARPGDYNDARNGSNDIMYSHAISGVLLCEVYGMTTPERADRIEPAVKAALDFIRMRQQRPMPQNREERDRGGWRYYRLDMAGGFYSDLSITSWMVMFMRSAENAGFSVPFEWADESLNYVRRCFDKKTGGFHYVLTSRDRMTRGMTAAGVLCLFLTGNGDKQIEQAAGKNLRKYPFDQFNVGASAHDRYFYSCYYCSQAAMQLGGETWSVLYPSIARALTKNQRRDGSWDQESYDSWTGNVYSSSMAILALTPPYQLLPIYQR